MRLAVGSLPLSVCSNDARPIGMTQHTAFPPNPPTPPHDTTAAAAAACCSPVAILHHDVQVFLSHAVPLPTPSTSAAMTGVGGGGDEGVVVPDDEGRGDGRQDAHLVHRLGPLLNGEYVYGVLVLGLAWGGCFGVGGKYSWVEIDDKL